MPLRHFSEILPANFQRSPTAFPETYDELFRKYDTSRFIEAIAALDNRIFLLCGLFQKAGYPPFVLHAFLEGLKAGKQVNREFVEDLFKGQDIDPRLKDYFVAIAKDFNAIIDGIARARLTKARQPAYQKRAMTVAVFEAIRQQLCINELQQLDNDDFDPDAVNPSIPAWMQQLCGYVIHEMYPEASLPELKLTHMCHIEGRFYGLTARRGIIPHPEEFDEYLRRLFELINLPFHELVKLRIHSTQEKDIDLYALLLENLHQFKGFDAYLPRMEELINLSFSELKNLRNNSTTKTDIDFYDWLLKKLYPQGALSKRAGNDDIKTQILPGYLQQDFTADPPELKSDDMRANVQAMLGQFMLAKFLVRFNDYRQNELLKQLQAMHFDSHRKQMARFFNGEEHKIEYCENAKLVDATVAMIKAGFCDVTDFALPDYGSVLMAAYRDDKITRDECVTYLTFQNAYLEAAFKENGFEDFKVVELLDEEEAYAKFIEYNLTDKPLREELTPASLALFMTLLKQLPSSQKIYAVIKFEEGLSVLMLSESMHSAFLIARSGLDNAVPNEPMLGVITREHVEQCSRKGTRPETVAMAFYETTPTLIVHGETVGQTGSTVHDKLHAVVTSGLYLPLRNVFHRLIDVFRILRKDAPTPWSKAIWKLADMVFSAINENGGNPERGGLLGDITELFTKFLDALEVTVDDNESPEDLPPTLHTDFDYNDPSCLGWLFGIDMVFNQGIYEQAGIQFDKSPSSVTDLWDQGMRHYSKRYAYIYNFVFQHSSWIAGDEPKLQLLKLSLFHKLSGYDPSEINRVLNEAWKNPEFRAKLTVKRDNRIGVLSVCFDNKYLIDQLYHHEMEELYTEIQTYANPKKLDEVPEYVYIKLDVSDTIDPYTFYRPDLSAFGEKHHWLYPVYPNLDCLLEELDLQNNLNMTTFCTGRQGRDYRPVVLKVEKPKDADWKMGKRYFKVDGLTIPIERVCGYMPLSGVMNADSHSQQLYVYETPKLVPNPQFVSQYPKVPAEMASARQFAKPKPPTDELRNVFGPSGLQIGK